MALSVGDEIGVELLSPKRLHDLRHGSVSIMLSKGVDITIASKVVGHSSTSVTANLYAYLLRSTGQQAAETVAAAIPRTTVRPHPVLTTGTNGGGIVKGGGFGPGQGPARKGQAPTKRVEVAGIEPASSGTEPGLLRAEPATCFSAPSDSQAS